MNDDNDGGGPPGSKDNADQAINANDDDIVLVMLKRIAPSDLAEGRLELTVSPPDKLRVFRPGGAGALSDYSVNLAQPAGDLAALAQGDVSLPVEGLEPCGNVTLKLVYRDMAGREVSSDEVQLSVLSVDVVGHRPGTMAAPGAEVSNAEEDSPLNVLARVNDDNDDGGPPGQKDNRDTLVGAADDDVVCLTLSPPAPVGISQGTLTLTVVPASVRVLAPNGASELADRSVNLAAPQGQLAALAQGEVRIWLEGTAPCADVRIKLAYLSPAGVEVASDEVHLSVLKVDLQGHRQGTMAAPGAEVFEEDEEAPFKLLAAVNDDNDDGGPPGRRDNADTTLGANDDNLVKLTLRAVAPGSPGQGTLELTVVPAGAVRFYKPDGSGLLADTVIDLASPAGDLAPLAAGDLDVWAEGLASGADVRVKLTLRDPAGAEIASDIVRVDIVRVDVQVRRPGTRATPGAEIVDAEEDDPLKVVVKVNDDNDAGGPAGQWDNRDAVIGPTDDDIVCIVLKPLVPGDLKKGTMTLSVNSGSVRLLASDGTRALANYGVALATPVGDLAGLASAEVRVWLEGVLAGEDVQVSLAYTDEGGTEIGRDVVHFTVFKVEVRGHWPGTPTVPGAQVSEADEDNALKLVVMVNDDNDDGGPAGQQDNRDDAATAADDNMAKLYLRRPLPVALGPGTLDLSVSPPGAVRLLDPAGAALLTDLSVDLTSPVGQLAPLALDSVNVWLEGLAPCADVTIRLSYKDPDGHELASDEVHLAVLRIDLNASQPGTLATPGPAVSEADEEKPLSLILGVNDDRDPGGANPPAPAADKVDNVIGAADDDIVRLTLLPPNPMLGRGAIEVVTVPAAAVRVYVDNGTRPLTNYSVDLAAPAGDLQDLANGQPVTLRVEGLVPTADVTVSLRYSIDGAIVALDDLHMAVVSVDIDPMPGNQGVNGDLVDSNCGNGARDQYHYVTPQSTTAGDAVTFKATIQPAAIAFAGNFEWTGGSAAGNVDERVVDRTQAASLHPVSVRAIGQNVNLDTMKVWIVWSTMTRAQTVAIGIVRGQVQPAVGAVGPGTLVKCKWSFDSTILPNGGNGIILAVDRPALNGSSDAAGQVPNSTTPHINDGQPYGQPPNRWDISRQMRLRILSPAIATADFSAVPGTLYNGLPAANLIVQDYPAVDTEGNDDNGPNREDTDPYTDPDVGHLTDTDPPGLPMLVDRAGVPGDTVEVRVQLREFVRLQIGTRWYRTSDFAQGEWRHHGRLKRVWLLGVHDLNGNGTFDPGEGWWEDNGSVSDSTNDGW